MGRDCYGHAIIASAVAVTLPRIGESNKNIKNKTSLMTWLSWIYDIKLHSKGKEAYIKPKLIQVLVAS